MLTPLRELIKITAVGPFCNPFLLGLDGDDSGFLLS
jgi:hypothetical protein